jgi:transcription elongation factor SPT5
MMSDDEADIARDVNLPSSLDSKLWRLKVKPGMERQLVMRLTNKLFAYLNNGKPLMVLQVFECENTSGAVFVEAYKLSHVEQLTRGIAGIYSRGLKMIPIGEMTDVMKSCSVMKECPVEPKQWVRIAKGPFKNDLALIEKVLGSHKVILRVLPRIPDKWIYGQTDASKKVP